MEDPVVRLERNLYGHPSAGLLWDRQFEKALLEPGWEKVPIWECFFLTDKKGVFLSVFVDGFETGRQDRKHRTDFGNSFMKDVDLGERTWEFPQEELKNYHARNIWVSLRCPMVNVHEYHSSSGSSFRKRQNYLGKTTVKRKSWSVVRQKSLA